MTDRSTTYPWLTARPIAHRGLHDKALGILENTAAAASKAIERHYAIECDVQLSRDGEAMVFHDFSLERLTLASGEVENYTSAQLQAISFRNGNGAILPLAAFMGVIGGRVPLICEIKSRFDGDMRLSERALAVALAQPEHVALKSFDPAVIIYLRSLSPPLPLGIIAEGEFKGGEWDKLSEDQLSLMTNFTHFSMSKPDFLSWNIRNFPHPTPYLLRNALNIPVMTWTVRNAEQIAQSKKWADQMVFEGFTP